MAPSFISVALLCVAMALANGSNSEENGENSSEVRTLRDIDERLRRLEAGVDKIESYMRETMRRLGAKLVATNKLNKRQCKVTEEACRDVISSLQSLVPTTPAPTCPWGFTLIRGSCYRFHGDIAWQSMASVMCMKERGRLVTIETGDEQAMLLERAAGELASQNNGKPSTTMNLWIGATRDVGGQGDFTWEATGQALSYGNWEDGALGDHIDRGTTALPLISRFRNIFGISRDEQVPTTTQNPTRGRCVAFNVASGKWSLSVCNTFNGYICESAPTYG